MMTHGARGALAAIIVVGLGCGRTELWPPPPSFGELQIVTRDHGQPIAIDAASRQTAIFELGQVVMGERAGTWLVVRNSGEAPLQLEAFEKRGGDSVRVTSSDPEPDPVFTLESETALLSPGEERSFALAFHAPADGAPAVAHETALLARASNTKPGLETVPVIVRGLAIRPAEIAPVGTPDIEVTPAGVLDLGRVTMLPGSPVVATGSLFIANVGVKPVPVDALRNLRLGAGGGGRPWWSITPRNAGSAPGEVCLGRFDANGGTCTAELPAYEPSLGVEVGARLEIPVWIAPATAGLKSWDVTFHSNDPDEPDVTVAVQLEAVTPPVTPPCHYSVSPTLLDFGLVTAPAVSTMGFEIRNVSSTPGEVCVISALGLVAGSHPTFQLPSGSIASRTLQPGEALEVPVRASPQGQLNPWLTTIHGEVGFDVSDPAHPHATVALSAVLGQSCLTISPNDLDFGTVQVGCGGPERTFLVYNTCTIPVTVQRSQMTLAAGEPAGGPNCPGATPCPEFEPVAGGGLVPGTVIQPGGAAPISFSLRYQPINQGADQGAFAIRVTQSGSSVDYVVTLRGEGDLRGFNTDTFWQQSQQRADILLVIDDSCSMSDKQDNLANNLAAFLRYATSRNVDFQIAVTNTEMSDSYWPHGVFKESPGGYRILRPSTTDLATEYAALVHVGINGGYESCADPAVRALTAPFITDPTKNAGFLRPDAVLAVVCVTDAMEQGPQPMGSYLSQLQNIKGAQHPAAFTYNVIGPFLAGPPPGCSYDSMRDDGSHEDLVRQTNGVQGEICTADWAATLENVGRSAFGYRASFYLTAVPDLSAGHVIEVKVDGVTVPAVDARGVLVWRYGPLTNSIDFEPLYVPEAGHLVVVTYQVPCLP